MKDQIKENAKKCGFAKIKEFINRKDQIKFLFQIKSQSFQIWKNILEGYKLKRVKGLKIIQVYKNQIKKR
jgi:hypothetical protein